MSVGLKPFVELLPTYGKVGKTIDILGQGLTGTTGVSFDGVAATFNNVSDTYITAVITDRCTHWHRNRNHVYRELQQQPDFPGRSPAHQLQTRSRQSE